MFYVDTVRGDRAELTGETARHLRKVLRAEEGQRYEISDNEQLYLAEISAVGRDLIEFSIVEKLNPPSLQVRLHLCAALIKFDHFEWMLEKATELGVQRITPVIATRTERGLDHAAAKRAARWERILLESGQQCRRVTRPDLDSPTQLKDVLAEPAGCRLFLDEARTGQPILAALTPATSATLLVGPEGGWDDHERHLVATSGWTPVTLSPLVLRAETAAIAGLSIVAAYYEQQARASATLR